jgi:hypothetical protein
MLIGAEQEGLAVGILEEQDGVIGCSRQIRVAWGGRHGHDQKSPMARGFRAPRPGGVDCTDGGGVRGDHAVEDGSIGEGSTRVVDGTVVTGCVQR